MASKMWCFDTETTGLSRKNDRVVEIGAVEIVDRKLTGRYFHAYLNPQRSMPEEAFKVHGLSDEFLRNKPLFSEVARSFIEAVRGSILVAHNASFDIGFINAELARLTTKDVCIEQYVAGVEDTMKIARKQLTGSATLDAVAKKLGIQTSDRTLHGALLDSMILADVYLGLTTKQMSMSKEISFNTGAEASSTGRVSIHRANSAPLKTIHAASEELAAHNNMMQRVMA